MLHPCRALRVRTIVWLAVLVAIPALLPGTAAAQDTASAPGLSPRLLADASWHGRPIQRPLPQRSDVTDRAPSLRPGTGFSRPGGSRRVRALQQRLTRLGYRPGARDGLFGPRTQAAVLAFQRKHGIERTGSVGSDTLRVLARRTAPGATSEPRIEAQSRPATPSAPPATPAIEVTPASDTDGLPVLAVLLILAVTLPVLALVSLFVRRRTIPEPAYHGTPHEERSEPAPPPPVVLAPPPAQPEPISPPEEEIPRIRKVAPVQHHHHHGPPRDRRIALRERILRMRADGMSLQEIADTLTAEGEVTLGGGRHWQPWSVRAATRPVSPGNRSLAHGRRDLS